MQKYECLIFDVDHTLLDYTADEHAAFTRLFRRFNIPMRREDIARCNTISHETWTQAGLFDVHDEKIQAQYHTLYKTHLALLFSKVFAEFSIDGDVKAYSEQFLKELEEEGRAFAKAEEVLSALQKKYRLFVATNGLSSIQRGRLKKLAPYFESAFISEEIGFIKPREEFFSHALLKTGTEKEKVLMIGDSLSSDVVGAKNFGLAACWFNPFNQENLSAVLPDYEIENLTELLDILA